QGSHNRAFRVAKMVVSVAESLQGPGRLDPEAAFLSLVKAFHDWLGQCRVEELFSHAFRYRKQHPEWRGRHWLPKQPQRTFQMNTAFHGSDPKKCFAQRSFQDGNAVYRIGILVIDLNSTTKQLDGVRVGSGAERIIAGQRTV